MVIEPGTVVESDTDEPDPAALAGMFVEYGKAARGTAVKARTTGDRFGETLANSRANVYDKAAELVQAMPLADAAAEMMSRAKAFSVRSPPLIGFDPAGEAFVQARAWQFCAWKLDPTLPQVQAAW
jgi:hypothetical protein